MSNLYDSDQELYFSYWLDDLKKEGYVIDYEVHPPTFVLSGETIVPWHKQLKTKTSDKQKTIRSGISYTVDFKVLWNISKTDGVLTFTDFGVYDKTPTMPFYCPSGRDYSYIEVKPPFDRNNMTRGVKIKIAWVWELYREHVDIIIPDKLFKKTFYPDQYMTTLSGTPRRKKNKKGKLIPLKSFVTTRDEFFSDSDN